MKCRLKKKAEFEKLRDDFNQLKEDKIILNSQVTFFPLKLFIVLAISYDVRREDQGEPAA